MTANSQKNPDRWFPRKRYVLMIASKKACKLSYHQRLVYSYLVFRRSREQGAATSKIANVLRIDREAASRALYRLASEWSLVENRDGRFWACEPTDQTSTWFANNRRDGDPWHRRFSTFRVYPPTTSCPLSTKANGLLWLLYSLAPRWGTPVVINQNIRGLSRLLGVTQKCVRANLTALSHHQLVVEATLMFSMQQPTSEQLEWWRDRPVKQEPKKNTFLLAQALDWAAVDVGPNDHPDVKRAKENVRTTRRTHLGADGRPVNFNARRKAAASTSKRKTPSPTTEPLDDVVSAVRSLGLPWATAADVGGAVTALFPSGLSGLDQGEVIRAVFVSLKRRTR